MSLQSYGRVTLCHPLVPGHEPSPPRDVLAGSLALGASAAVARKAQATTLGRGLDRPASIYINWGVYDELSDNVPLTEKLAMAQFDELLRLRQAGARFDYYKMDCFWFDQQGSYRKWRTPNFPSGGKRWLSQCKQHGGKPGLCVGMNANWGSNPKPVLESWKRSHDPRASSMCMFAGGFLQSTRFESGGPA